MQVHAIGNGAYAAYISGAELKIRNIAPDHLEKMEKKELLELFDKWHRYGKVSVSYTTTCYAGKF